jgi:hypothetical protein
MTVEVGNWQRTGNAGIEVKGSIGERWAELGGSTWGYPITDELIIAKGHGRVVHFRQPMTGIESSIYWTHATGAVEVVGPIRAVWVAAGFETGPLGLPSGREQSWPEGGPGGTQQRFAGGRIVADPHRGISPDPVTFVRPLAEGPVKGWVSTRIFWDGQVHNSGELTNLAVESHDFDVHIRVTHGKFGIAAQWHDHVAGSLERGRSTARWSQQAQLPEVAGNFWQLQHADYLVSRRHESTFVGPPHLDGLLRGSWRDGADPGLPVRAADLRRDL